MELTEEKKKEAIYGLVSVGKARGRRHSLPRWALPHTSDIRAVVGSGLLEGEAKLITKEPASKSQAREGTGPTGSRDSLTSYKPPGV